MSPATAPSRWCPTPEQVMILEEIYRNGLKTPNATQIQHITSHLSLYGKIEGKNVFYWFQNHKARDRQKLRRKLYKQLQQQQQLLMKHHRFNEQPFFHYFLQQQPQQQRVHQQLELPGFCYEHGQRELGEVAKAEVAGRLEGGGRGWFVCGQDGTMMAAENGGAETTTCRGGSLRTLELFPVRASGAKEEERGSGSGSSG